MLRSSTGDFYFKGEGREMLKDLKMLSGLLEEGKGK